MYANGIRKIFDSNKLISGSDIEESKKIATELCYDALTFNGRIWIRDHRLDKWVLTCFTIEDFQ